MVVASKANLLSTLNAWAAVRGVWAFSGSSLEVSGTLPVFPPSNVFAEVFLINEKPPGAFGLDAGDSDRTKLIAGDEVQDAVPAHSQSL